MTMDNVDEAKELIQSIRKAKNVDNDDGSDESANDLEKALNLCVVLQPES